MHVILQIRSILVRDQNNGYWLPLYTEELPGTSASLSGDKRTLCKPAMCLCLMVSVSLTQSRKRVSLKLANHSCVPLPRKHIYPHVHQWRKPSSPYIHHPNLCQSSPLTDAITSQERLLLANSFTTADRERRNSQFSRLLLHLWVPAVQGLFWECANTLKRRCLFWS